MFSFSEILFQLAIRNHRRDKIS